MTSRRKYECYQVWTHCTEEGGSNIDLLEKKHKSVFRTYKKAIGLSKPKYVSRIGKRWTRYPSGSHAIWFLAEALQVILLMDQIIVNKIGLASPLILYGALGKSVFHSRMIKIIDIRALMSSVDEVIGTLLFGGSLRDLTVDFENYP
ncbi:hypothetical protein EVAR_81978_1 [Eumeta japonica]|uniref:Uncharacterized protein n=1 Tax=Eumeta variegata TaxID=151549 RepID=A0A4C1VTT6_EUMVA|nr:hypothetical protein EVAR_81978_1 [Eumeta japonica]